MKNKKIGIYPGTFDPITFGHFDIILRSLKIVDMLIIAVTDNSNKTPLFPIKNRIQMLNQEITKQAPDIIDSKGILKEVKLIIWTTTPWTIPANEAISVNQKLEYVIAQSSDRSLIIIANDLLEEVSKSVGIKYEKRVLIKGSILDGIIYKHPLFDKLSPVVLGGDYITTESGTGLVHTAPGHGVDDFNTGKKYDFSLNEIGVRSRGQIFRI